MLERGLPERPRDERAKQVGQWVTIGSYAAYAAVAWIGTELLAPALGHDFAVGIFVMGSVFVALGAMRFGERMEWWYAARRKRSAR